MNEFCNSSNINFEWIMPGICIQIINSSERKKVWFYFPKILLNSQSILYNINNILKLSRFSFMHLLKTNTFWMDQCQTAVTRLTMHCFLMQNSSCGYNFYVQYQKSGPTLFENTSLFELGSIYLHKILTFNFDLVHNFLQIPLLKPHLKIRLLI